MTTSVTDTSPKPHCSFPDCTVHSDKSLMRCTKCRDALYCGPVCQKADWPEHKKVCKRPKAEVSGTTSTEGTKAGTTPSTDAPRNVVYPRFQTQGITQTAYFDEPDDPRIKLLAAVLYRINDDLKEMKRRK